MKLLTIFFIALLLAKSIAAHPLKMAYTSIKYIKDRRVFEISHRVFQDDFESSLKSSFPCQGDVYLNQNDPSLKNSVNRYFQKNFSISLNNARQELRYVKTEQKNQMGVIVYYETGKLDISTLSTIDVFDSILIESFKEQVNMFNLNIDGLFKRTITFNNTHLRETIRL